jgi:hypothetical protein
MSVAQSAQLNREAVRNLNTTLTEPPGARDIQPDRAPFHDEGSPDG